LWLAPNLSRLKGRPVFLCNLVGLKHVRWDGPELSAGEHTLEFDFTYNGLGTGTLAFNIMSGIGEGGAGVLKVDGREVARQTLEHTVPVIWQWDENFDNRVYPV
jgi:arylsulfatase